MATSIPAKLKTADVQRFATRAAQLEKFRPIVTYWCEYFILQIILNKQLHTGDDEVQAYAIHLMDKLEAYKSANATNDAVVDDLAAKAYIENFALETFGHADDAQRNDKVTRSTADTFQAAATFLDLLSIWGPLESEASAKSKFAKFHALRIARALKAGEDPNATNPKIEEPPKPEDDDGVNAELRDLERQGQGLTPGYQQPTVESVPDTALPSRSASTLQGGIGAPPTLPAQNINEPAPDVSPIDTADSASRTGSVGGGYFPSVPTGTSSYQPAPETPGTGDFNTDSISNEIHIPPAVPSSDPSSFYNTSEPSAPPIFTNDPLPPTFTDAPPPTDLPPSAPPVTARAPITPQPSSFAPPPLPTPAAAPAPSGPPAGGYRTDDESVAMAQKHAKWAISALNFEDVPTAVKELRIALGALGAL